MSAPDGRAAPFLQQLAAEFDEADVELPGFPEVVGRLQTLLSDDDVSIEAIVDLIATDPVFSAKLLRIANAAAFNPIGAEIQSLNIAVGRLGLTLLRSVALAFALRQAEQSEWLNPVRDELQELWRTSNRVAAICAVVARKALEGYADHAMLAGLVHQIGTLYVLLHMQRSAPELMNAIDYDEAVREYGPPIARKLLDAWQMPLPICDAVETQDALLARRAQDLEPLSQLVAAAKLFDSIEHDPQLRRNHPTVEALLASVQLPGGSFADITAASAEEIQDIQNTLA